MASMGMGRLRNSRASAFLWMISIACLGCCMGVAQQLPQGPHPLDPSRSVAKPMMESAMHSSLPEEYIWTAAEATGDSAQQFYRRPAITEQTEVHYFRDEFQVASVPRDATLYLAGPRSVKVWLNGRLAEVVSSDTSSPLGLHVFTTPVAKFLRTGKNTIAIEAVRGRGVSGFANSALMRQQTFGQVLVAKIVPAAPGIVGPPLLVSGRDWKSSTKAYAGWQQPQFNDAIWMPVQSIGGIESSVELFQWNADTGLYNWPGYDGISPYLAHMQVPAQKVLESYTGRGAFTNLEALTVISPAAFSVSLPAPVLTDAEGPSILLDFGEELTGRLELVSDSDTTAIVTIQMGESQAEALKGPYLGVNQLVIPPHGTGHGPKSSFRYAKVRFVGGGQELRFKSIHIDHIFYPVTYAGSFESSDAMLNRIWEVGAYTAHLCMQDGIWDAPKRDRGRWMGDTDVSGRVIEDVFGEHTLMEDTLDRLMGPEPVAQHVNGIPGYSAFWFTGVADYYRHSGAKDFLLSEHDRMLELLRVIDAEFDDHNLYANKSNAWPFVDWSPDLNGDTPEARRATTLEFYRAYREAAFLLRESGDIANADKYDARATAVKAAAEKYLLDPATGTFGPRWQTNAAAVIGGAAAPEHYAAIWNNVLSGVGKDGTHGLIITPYYNYYVIRAMAELGHRREAIDWIKQFWGGMIDEGATSFWEGYDTSWYKGDYHASLQADNNSGYIVSLAHGWSAGPTAWLMEQVLGIKPTGAGFSTVDVRPDLAGLAWAKGAEPTPHGLLRVDVKKSAAGFSVAVDVPEGVAARVSLPVTAGSTSILVDGKPVTGIQVESGTRMTVLLSIAGHHELSSQ